MKYISVQSPLPTQFQSVRITLSRVRPELFTISYTKIFESCIFSFSFLFRVRYKWLSVQPRWKVKWAPWADKAFSTLSLSGIIYSRLFSTFDHLVCEKIYYFRSSRCISSTRLRGKLNKHRQQIRTLWKLHFFSWISFHHILVGSDT